jgi:hypothetical protein
MVLCINKYAKKYCSTKPRRQTLWLGGNNKETQNHSNLRNRIVAVAERLELNTEISIPNSETLSWVLLVAEKNPIHKAAFPLNK